MGRFHKSKDTVKKNVLGERSHSMAFLICGLEWTGEVGTSNLGTPRIKSAGNRHSS